MVRFYTVWAVYPRLPLLPIIRIHEYGNGKYLQTGLLAITTEKINLPPCSVPIKSPACLSEIKKLYFWTFGRDSNTVVLATDIVIGSFGCSLRVTP